MTEPASAQPQVDLTNCDREPIHVPGHVQPHGVLLVLDPGSLKILQASENTQALLGIPVVDLLALPIAKVLGDSYSQVLVTAKRALGDSPLFLFTVPTPSHGAFEVIAHVHQGLLLLELEPVGAPAANPPDFLELLKGGVARFQGARSVTDFCQLSPSMLSRTLENALLKHRLQLQVQDAQRRTAQLLQLTQGLSRLATRQDMVGCIVDRAHEAFAAAGTAVALLSRDGATLSFQPQARWPGGQEAERAIDDLTPVDHCVRTGQLVTWESEAERDARFPLHNDALRGYPALAAIPIQAANRQAGAIVLVFERPREFPAEERDFLTLVGDLCGQALERAFLFEQAEATRAEARSALALAQDAVVARDQVMAVVSHDLKNPLNVLLMSVEVFRRQLDGRAPRVSDQKMLEMLDRVLRQIKQMDKLVDELLDVVRLRAGLEVPLTRAPVALVALVTGLAGDHQQSSPSHRIEVVATPTAIIGAWDANQLDRVVSNLLSNAVKFSPRAGLIKAELEESREGETTFAVLRVTDSGMGVSAADLPRIFDWYARGTNARDTTIRGLGLGLAGARQVVGALGGTLTVESEENKGSTFTLRLPR